MELSSSFKKSFDKSSKGSLSCKQKHGRKISAGKDPSFQEGEPILPPTQRAETSGSNADDCREVIVKIDPSGGNNIWRENSYEFWMDEPKIGGGGGGGGGGFQFPDPPSELIDQFMNKQRAAGAEIPFDADYTYDNIKINSNSPPEIPITVDLKKSQENREPHQKIPSRDIKVSFQSAGSDSDEVLKCTSRRPSILRNTTRSRLMDPPEPDRAKSSGKVGARSGQVRSSGITNRVSGTSKPPVSGEIEEEDDPLLGDDVPDKFQKGNLNALTVLQWVSLVLIVAALVCTLVIRAWKNRQFKGLNMWKWEVLILVLICGRLVSGWGIRILVFFIERNYLLRKRVLYFVYGVRKAVQNCIWLGLVLLAWHFFFDKRIEKETNAKFLRYVNKILICFLVGCLLWLVKTLMVKVLASSFHVSTFFDRIQESLFNQDVIKTLSAPPMMDQERAMASIQQFQSAGINVPPDLKASTFTIPPIRTLSKKFSRVGSSRNANGENNNKEEQGIPIEHLEKLNPKNISAWSMKRLMKMVRQGLFSTLDEQIYESNNGDESSKQIRSELEAKAAARKIFQNVARRGSKYIYITDLMLFMEEDKASKTMALLGGSTESEKISKYALKNWVVNVFRERKALALSLNDTKTAVNKLHQMVNVLVGIIILIVCLLILELASSKVLVFISSQIVVVAFVFGNTAKTVFESIIFLFVMHPFDVGDRCEIDGVQMIVEEMNILNTIFLRFDNQKIFYPNSTLLTKNIGNYYRSPDMGDSVDFYIHVTTPAEKVAIMKQRIISYIENKKDHWYSSPSVVFMNFEYLHMVKMSVWVRHRMNHQDMGEKWMRRALLVEEMTKIFKEFDIEYRLIPRDINIRSMPTITTTRTPSGWDAKT